MTTELNTKLRLTADNSDLLAKTQQVKAQSAEVGATVQKIGAQATEGFSKATASAQSFGTAAASVNKVVDEIGQRAKSAGSAGASGFDAVGASARGAFSQIASLNQMLETEAKTLADVTVRREAYNKALADGVIWGEEYTAATAALAKQEAVLVKQEDALAAARTRATAAAEKTAAIYLDGSAATRKLAADEERLTAAYNQGLISQERYAAASAALALKQKAALDDVGHSASAATRELGVMSGEALRGNFARLEQSTVTLANRTGFLTQSITFLVSPIGLVTAGVAALLALFALGQAEFSGINQSIIQTGNYAGVTAQQVLSLGNTVGGQTGKIRESRAALQELLVSGRVTGDQLGVAARGVVDFATVTGQSIDKAVQQFERLAEDPLKASVKLNEQFHYLTIGTYEQIDAAEKLGDTQQAQSIAEQAFADAFAQRAKQTEENLGTLETAWKKIKDTAKDAWDAMLNVGRPKSLDQQIDGVKAEIDAANARLIDLKENPHLLSKLSGTTYVDESIETEEISRLQLALDSLNTKRLQQQSQEASNALAAMGNREQQEAIAAQQDLDKLTVSVDKNAAAQQKIARAASDLYKVYIAGGKLPAGVSFDGPVADIPVGAGWDKLKSEIQGKKAPDHSARDATELAAAMKALDDILDSTAGKTDHVAAAQAEYNKGMRQLQADAERAAVAGGDVNVIIAKWQQGESQLKTNLALANAEIAKRNTLTNGNKDLVETLGQQRDQLAGLTQAQVDYNKAADAAAELATKAIADGQAQDVVAAGLEDRLKKLAEIRDNAEVVSIVDQFGSKSDFERLTDDIAKVQEALTNATDPKIVARLTTALGNVRQKMVEGIVASSQEGLRSLQSMTTDGSKAFEAMKIAIDALTVVQAISAVLNQAQGDPYTAFARMAAMAAAVVALGVDIAHFGGGNSGPSAASAEVRQKEQGTGSVLGDATAQSDSIAKAIDITANATTQLVGLNRGMLTALQALQSALGAAGTQLAQGAADVTFPGFKDNGNLLDPFGKDPIGGAVGGLLFGGSKKVIDQGITIAGGTLSDMLNSIVVGAYQTVKTKGGLFGGGGTKDSTVDISDEFSKQFQLVISSISDTVRQGALALGALPADVDAALASFKLEATRISLSGLSAEDQQKAIEAVFSKIFDGLAGAVVPYIGQFQKVGEGLGETLVRVATEVQVSQEAFKQLGLSVKETDPEKFAQIADAMVTAAGGLDSFISGFQSFVDKFEPDSKKFQYETDALKSGLAQVGLTLPTTRDGMYELMQSLDATTDAGRAQIAMLLRLTDTADAYYSEIDSLADKYKKFIAPFNAATSTGTAFQQSMQGINEQLQANIQTANDLAKAQGLQGASAEDIAKIITVSAQQGAAAIRQAWSNALQGAQQLYGSDFVARLKQQLQDQTQATGFFDPALVSQINQAQQFQQQQAQGQRFLQATNLAGEIADILATQSDENLSSVLTKLGIPLDAFQQDLQLQGQSLDDYIGKLEDQAKINLDVKDNTATANKLLQNILDVLVGKPLAYTSEGAFVPLPTTATVPGGNGKPGGRTFTGPDASGGTLQVNLPEGDGSTQRAIERLSAQQDAHNKRFVNIVGSLVRTIERRGLNRQVLIP